MNKILPLTAALMALAVTPALAQQAGTKTFGFGVGYVAPKDDNGSLSGGTMPTSVGNDLRPTITFEYFIRDNLGIEVLAATPFEHTIDIDGLGEIGSTQHLPPTVTLQYHLNGDSTVSPFFGVGVNYTTFFKEETRGALAGSKLELDDSFGLALHAGLDIAVTDNAALRTDVRWMDIDTDVKVDGKDLGTVEIDPVVFGVSYVMKF